MIHGNLTGIRESTLNELEKLYDAEFGREAFLPDRLRSAESMIRLEMLRFVFLNDAGGLGPPAS